ncbi:MAG: hypothetical protein HY685_02440 [Chloroflexi bacterium]|nr:hypothetical protein [Chloroflexota bacterium]
MDTYSVTKGYSVPGVVTGKPVEIGGSKGRYEATGRSCAIVAREAARHIGLDLKGARLAVQGFGQVGSVAARLLVEMGCRLVAASDSTGLVVNEKGLDPVDLKTYAPLAPRGVRGYPKGETVEAETLFDVPCDVFVPAAVGGVLTKATASRLQAKLVIEGANGPTTPEGDQALQSKGVFIVPDVLANAGGVTVSYFEWVQDLQAFFWEEGEINARLEKIMVRAFQETLATALRESVDMRTAAQMLAIHRVAEATRLRGLYP